MGTMGLPRLRLTPRREGEANEEPRTTAHMNGYGHGAWPTY